jgi:pyridinium-3,5-biscarboxylic acid mononucleotide sulfurtransferase
MPCLSSRIPHGQPVTAQSLSRVEKAEALLLATGYQIVRVRHLLSEEGPVARILVSPAEVPRLLAEAPSLRPALLDCGFNQIEFDPAGYQGLIA